jgi:hypothetical protein
MKAKVNSKIVFFKYNEKDESFLISNDYIVKDRSKTGGLKVMYNYRGKIYPKQREFWIPQRFLNTKSDMWQQSRSRPKYFVREMPFEYNDKQN